MPVVVYGIFDKATNDCLYVGRSAVFSMRQQQHKKGGSASSKPLQAYIKEHKIDVDIRKLEVLNYSDEPAEREAYWINFYKDKGKLFNRNMLDGWWTATLNVRVSYEQFNKIKKAAEIDGISMSEWCRRILLKAVEESN